MRKCLSIRKITAALAGGAVLVGLAVVTPPALADSQYVATKIVELNTSVYSGDRLSYQVQANCSDPKECQNVKITLTKPVGASGPGSIAKGPAAQPYPEGVTAVHENADGTVDFLFSAAGAGASIALEVSWPTASVSTPAGDQPVTMTTVYPDGSSDTKSATINLKADATPIIEKSGATSTLPDQYYTYKIALKNQGPDDSGNHGNLMLTNTVVVDQLPAEATFAGCSHSCIYDSGTHAATWDLGDYSGSDDLSVTVIFPAAAVNKMLTNTVDVTGTPLGQAIPKTDHSEWPVTISDASPTYDNAGFKKYASGAAVDGATLTWTIEATNNNNVPVNMKVTDTMPAGFELTSVNGGWIGYRQNIRPGSTVTFTYADDSSSAAIPFDGASIPVPRTDSRVTKAVFAFASVPIGGMVPATLVGTVHTAEIPQTPSGTIATLSNCADLSVENQTVADRHECGIVETSAVPVPVPVIRKSGPAEPVAPGGTVTFTFELDNQGNAGAPFMPDLYDMIPNEVTYVPGSLRADAANDAVKCMPAADFVEQIVPGFTAGVPSDDGSRTMVHWTAKPGSTGVLAGIRNECRYSYDTTVNPGTASGVRGGDTWASSYQGNLIYGFDRDVRIPREYSDTHNPSDIKGDGDLAQAVVFAGGGYTVATSAKLWNEKEVRGDRDGAGEWFVSAEKAGMQDQHGTSTPGGTVDYRVTLGNYGNRQLQHFVAYDLLPSPNNPGVTSQRYADHPLGGENTWIPTMTGPVNPGLAAPFVKITYSTKVDPCRPEMDVTTDHSAPFYCNGQVDASFVDAGLVDDWSEIRSIRFDFGDTILNGGDNFTFFWSMDAPTELANGDPILGGERTWNKIAAQGIQVDGNIPLLAAEAPWVADQMYVPKFAVGDYVWYDTNADGVQDASETPVDGVTVELLNESGTFIGSTATNANGYYHFDGLSAGKYKVKFSNLPASYVFTNQSVGNDPKIDSDADTATGESAVFELGIAVGNVAPAVAADGVTADYIDRTLDAGIVGTPKVSIKKWSTIDGFPAGDFNDAPGKQLQPNAAEELTFTITNTGTEALSGVKVSDKTVVGDVALKELSCDFSKLGGPATGATWDGRFEVGASFNCTGTLPGLAAGASHSDLAAVTAVGFASGVQASDDDPWNAWTSAAGLEAPSISLVKYSSNDGWPRGHYATEDTSKRLAVSKDEGISFTITNNGAEPLVNIKVTDEDLAGPVLQGLSCDFTGSGVADAPTSGTTWAGPLAPGASFDCTGVQPGLKSGESAADHAVVTADGAGSKKAVTDDDEWYGKAVVVLPVKTSTVVSQIENPVEAPPTLTKTGATLTSAAVLAALLLAAGGVMMVARRRSRRADSN